MEWQCILTFAWSLPFVERSCAAQRDHAITLFVRMTPAIETLLKYRRTSSPCCRGSSAPCLPGLADAFLAEPFPFLAPVLSLSLLVLLLHAEAVAVAGD